MLNQNTYIKRVVILISILSLFSCNKLVEIPEPKNTLTTLKVFNNDAQAISAMAGVLSRMINESTIPTLFSNGTVTRLNSLSADELVDVSTPGNPYNTNSLLASEPDRIWKSAYLAVYGATGIIEGIAESKSPDLRTKTRVALTAEAKFIRAFSYFYLVNTYGDVPLVLTTDFNQTVNLPRTAVATIYKQITTDLLDAVEGLPADYSAAAGERIRANKWAAKALLARVYLFTGDNNAAVAAATEVIAQTALYQLEMDDLNHVFLKNSQEAIWQLQQNAESGTIGNGTAEAFTFLPNPLHTGPSNSTLSPYLMKAFEAGDLRKLAWVDSTDYTFDGKTTRYIYPYKYKVGSHNSSLGGPLTEYYMVLRLAEQYLIRAEANALAGQLGLAINDLNIVRRRAGIGALSSSLNREEVLAAVAKERQTELFMEWGHRWLDLKRTGKAREVLSAIPYKQPWRGDYQLLYPIPVEEIRKDHFLTQNPNY